jgi:type I restriction enzyme M protein
MITKQALGNILWGMADTLRDKVEDYKAYILSLLFFKRLSDNYHWEVNNKVEEFRVEYQTEPNPKQLAKIVTEAHDFKIPEGHHWKDVKEVEEKKKNEALNLAVNAIADANKDLKGVINTVRWNEPAPDGSGGKKISPVVLTQLMNHLDAVDLSNKNAPVDILGDAYEYLIKKFADENKGGTSAGQFYTPQEVVDIIVRYIKPKKGEVIYDPTCGSGGFLINAAKYVKESTGNSKSIRLRGQEDVWNTWAICNINMILHGLDAEIKKEDTLKNPKFIDGGEVEKFDVVLANFPFSLEDWWKNGKPKLDRKGKAVLKKDGTSQMVYPSKDEFADPYNRFMYGIPPFSNGDFAFIQHIIASLDDKGRAGVVCPQGVLFRGQPEKTEEEDGQNRKADDEYLIRSGFIKGINGSSDKNLKQNIIEAIVVLPGNLFYGTTIPGAIMFFNKDKPEERKDKILMVYAAKDGWYKEEANLNVLLPQDILRISTMLEAWGDKEIAESFMVNQKARLIKIIEANLAFELSEIGEKYFDDILELELKIEQFEKKDKLTTAQKKSLNSAKEKLSKLLEKKDSEIKEAQNKAIKEKEAIDKVKDELLKVFSDPELRKRYFSIVNMEELEENEFNLNIPRYVDTFEPEEEINLSKAISEFNTAVDKENELDSTLTEFIKILK